MKGKQIVGLPGIGNKHDKGETNRSASMLKQKHLRETAAR